jgi:exodeoxyribonuclease VII small subunit
MTTPEMFEELTRICDKLERGDLTLEEAMSEWERGVELQRKIDEELRSAERRLVQIVGPDGKISPFTEKK